MSDEYDIVDAVRNWATRMAEVDDSKTVEEWLAWLREAITQTEKEV